MGTRGHPGNWLLGLATCLALAPSVFAKIIYVDDSAPNGKGTGTSWADAYKSLGRAFEDAGSTTDEIRVAQGTYKPEGSQEAAFHLSWVNGISIRGGYAGLGASDPDVWDIDKYETILSGDVKGDDPKPEDTQSLINDLKRSDNIFQVVIVDSADANTVLEGFTIKGGNASSSSSDHQDGAGLYNDGGRARIVACRFVGNAAKQDGGAVFTRNGALRLEQCRFSYNQAARSGGALCSAGGSPVLISCEFRKNTASNGGGVCNINSPAQLINCGFLYNAGTDGGGMYSQNSDPCMINCVFSHNSAQHGHGGATYNAASEAIYINCTFSQNSASLPKQGGGIYNKDASLVLINCILWGNSDTSRGHDNWAQIYPVTGVSVRDSCVQGGWPGKRNTAQDPYIDDRGLGGDDLALPYDSNSVDGGDSSAVPRDWLDFDNDLNVTEQIHSDYQGHDRISGPSVDRGALEFQVTAPLGPVIYVDADADGTHDGRSWATAFASVQDARAAVVTYGGGVQEIRVAAGVYTPAGVGGSKAATFQLIPNVKLLGGYAGLGASDPNVRDVNLYETTLSGDLDRNDDNAGGINPRDDNCYHVVTAGGDTNRSTVLDGFTIRGGMADGWSDTDGAGLCILTGSPTIHLCTFESNAAQGRGGGIYCSDGDPNIQTCTIRNNSAIAGGGGIYCQKSSPEITDSEITGNRSDGNGPGILCEFNSSPLLAGNTITNNRTEEGWGGGICCTERSNPVISGNFIARNHAFDGGGVYGMSSNPNVVNNFIIANAASDDGGGLCFVKCPPPLIRNNTIVKNTANPQGGGIFCEETSAVITNCILWDNGDNFRNWTPDSNYCSVIYSCIPDGNPGTGNISTYPHFNDPANDDYDLASYSPCIDAGPTSEMLGPGETDYDGDTRASFAPADIGADEVSSSKKALDADRDGLPDDWEMEHFAGTSAKPQDDPDGDEVSNLDEFRRGTNPHIAPRAEVYVSSTSSAGGPLADGSQDHPFSSIQHAIDVVRDGGKVLVTAGTFTERLVIDGKVVYLQGGYDPCFVAVKDYTTISARGPGLGRGVLYSKVPGGSFSRFRVTDGHERDGGGMYFLCSSPLVTHNIITGNKSDDDGGGVSFYFGSNVRFIDNRVEGNASDGDNGGGIYCRESGPWIEDCSITGNSAEDAGAMFLRNADSNIVRCTITGNYASNDGGAIVSKAGSRPTIEDCNISYNDAKSRGGAMVLKEASEVILKGNCLIQGNTTGETHEGVWAIGKCKMTIDGVVRAVANDWTAVDLTLAGDGELKIDRDTSLFMDDCSLQCDLTGQGRVEVKPESYLRIEKDSCVSLQRPPEAEDSNAVLCHGLLHLKDEAWISDTHINVCRMSFEGYADGYVGITDSVIRAQAGAPYGQFFLEGAVHVKGTEIHADGDRYMDLDPSDFAAVIEAGNKIYVTITEGIGKTRGGLFELRGKPDLVLPIECDPNNPLLCRVDAVPPFDANSWMIEDLVLAEGAKVNLTNRFDFHRPFDEGGYDEVLYVRNLTLRKDSVLNTCFNKIYYENLTQDPCAVVESVPLLGFSLNNIAFDRKEEFDVRVRHNNLTDPPKDQSKRIHVDWVQDEKPDPNGMMRMCNLRDTDPKSPTHTYGQVIHARAMGLFAKSNEAAIQIRFEYLFEDPNGDGELVIYLSDSPDLMDPKDPNHYIEVAHVLHPPRDVLYPWRGRPGSAGSGRWGIFDQVVSVGKLNFIRGTRIELELLGGDRTSVLIDNWDPAIRCLQYCGDVIGGEHEVTEIDFIAALSECGRRIGEVSTSGPFDAWCLEGFFCDDGYVTIHDAMAVDWIDATQNSLCPSDLLPGDLEPAAYAYHALMTAAAPVGAGLKPALSIASAQTQHLASLQESTGRFLVAAKRYEHRPGQTDDFLSDRLYGLDPNGTLVGEPIALTCDRLNGRLVRDHRGTLYQVNLELGLICLTDEKPIVAPGHLPMDREDRHGERATVYVGFQQIQGDSWGHPLLDAAFDADGCVYVVPVVVAPAKAKPYLAAAKLGLDNPNQVPGYSLKQIFDDPPFANDNYNLTQLREVEVDDACNVYVLNCHHGNSSDILWVYGSDGKLVSRTELQKLGISAPIGLRVSSHEPSKLYLASSENEPNAESVKLYVLSSADPNVLQTIEIPDMGHITDIADDPATLTICVAGFIMQTIPSEPQIQKMTDLGQGSFFTILREKPFYEPRVAIIPFGPDGPVKVIYPADASGASELRLPLSVICVAPQ